jgi:uncharacterized cupredoxin-like copper-binding protein
MQNRTRRLASMIGLAAGAGLVLVGCSSGTSTITSTSAAPYAAPSSAPSSAAAAAPSATVSGTMVAVTEKEFSITLPQTAFRPGTYTFAVVNQGQFSHNLTIKGPGGDQKATATLPAGSSGEVTVTLRAGSYELWCSVDSHKEKGMDRTITVA